MTETRKRPVVPTKPKLENRRKSLTIRLRDEVRSELESCAAKYGRSLSEELESRMEVSLANKNQLKYEWGEDIFRVAAALATSLSHIEDWTEKKWTEDDRTAAVFKIVMPQIAQNYLDMLHKKPREGLGFKSFDKMDMEELTEAFAALSGLAPPRPKKAPVEVVVSED